MSCSVICKACGNHFIFCITLKLNHPYAVLACPLAIFTKLTLPQNPAPMYGHFSFPPLCQDAAFSFDTQYKAKGAKIL